MRRVFAEPWGLDCLAFMLIMQTLIGHVFLLKPIPLPWSGCGIQAHRGVMSSGLRELSTGIFWTNIWRLHKPTACTFFTRLRRLRLGLRQIRQTRRAETL